MPSVDAPKLGNAFSGLLLLLTSPSSSKPSSKFTSFTGSFAFGGVAEEVRVSEAFWEKESDLREGGVSSDPALYSWNAPRRLSSLKALLFPLPP
jgi:hypothetical protein